MMDQVKMMAKMKKIQKELSKTIVEVEAGDGAVTIQMNGEQKIKDVSLDTELIDFDDIGELETWIEQAFKKAEGINGYPAQQGFYVYRGNRLLLAGDWLGLFRKEEHYKLVRIQLDLPNTLDADWQIDIKKSTATPPAVCREQLKSYAIEVRNIGVEVYRHRGKILKQRAGQSFQPLWLEKKKDNHWSFVVNREHLMIQNLKIMAKEKPEQTIETLLKFLEETIPTKPIYINEAQSEETQKTPFSDMDINVIKQTLTLMFNSEIARGNTPEQVKDYLKTIEPFNNYEDLIDELI